MGTLDRSVRLATALLALCIGCASPPASAQDLWPDFPDAAQTPSATNHFNPQHNDAAPIDAPVGVRKLWQAIPEYAHFNACASGPEGNVYCTGFKEGGTLCNLVALDYKTGMKRWDDGTANGGSCLLDLFSFPTTPFVDRDGNVYAGDSQVIVSFTANGAVRWIRSHPADLTASSPTGRVNTPFGINMLPSGEIITGTLGDAFVLVMDADTGALLAEPFDVPSVKVPTGGAQSRPPWANNKFGCGDPNANLPPCGDTAADAAWDSSFADSPNENDNDLSVDGHTGTIFMTGAAEGPNPSRDGKLWALRYDATRPFTDRLSVRFTVRFPGPGGSATTPGIGDDGLYAVISNNTQQALIADIPMCLAAFGSKGTAANAYNECPHFGSVDLPNNLLASPTLTRDNILIVLGQQAGVLAFQLAGRGAAIGGSALWSFGPAQMVPICAKTVLLPGETLLPFPVPLSCTPASTARTAVSVISSYENVTYFAYTTLQILGVDAQLRQTAPRFAAFGPVTPTLVGVDTRTGAQLAIHTHADGVGELANVTMAADRSTLVINNFNFLSQVFWDRGLMGINPNPVLPPGPTGRPLDFFKLLQPKPFDQAAPGGVSAWVAERPELAITGAELSVHQKAQKPTSLKFESTDAGIEAPALGSALDPRRHGAELVLFNPDTGEQQEITLAAARWRFTDKFIYEDKDGLVGPCEKVTLTVAGLTASCKRPGITFSLDETSQGRLGVAFSVSPGRVLCALFGGVVTDDRVGLFAAERAEASDDCVVPE